MNEYEQVGYDIAWCAALCDPKALSIWGHKIPEFRKLLGLAKFCAVQVAIMRTFDDGMWGV